MRHTLTWVGKALPLAGGTMTGDIAMGGSKVTGLGEPTAQDDALRKARAEIINADIYSLAEIVYTKLDLALSIVHGDVATANKDGTTATPSMRTLGTGAQQAAAGDHTHTLAEDITGSAQSAILLEAAAAGYAIAVSVAAGSETDLATKTQSYGTASIAVAVGYANGEGAHADHIKLYLYMDDSLVASSAFIPAIAENTIVVGTRALSGSKICKVAAHNSDISECWLWVTSYGSTSPIGAGIGIGSVKIS